MTENQFLTFVLIAIIWTVPWKAIALWKAARSDNKKWFIVLFLVNTMAILEILYIYVFDKKKKA
jgi:hypothetical protein